MSLAKLDVVGFFDAASPFVQRVLAFLIATRTPFRYQKVDRHDKPQWFLEKSPLSKVPIVTFDNGQTLFESTVILEYLDSLLPPEKRFTPSNPLVAAQNKAWVEVINSIFSDMLTTIGKPTKEEFEAGNANILSRVSYLEKNIVGPYFNGDKISLIDIAAAPLLQRILVFDRLLQADIGNKAKHTKFAAWANTLISLPYINLGVTLQLGDPALAHPEENIDALASHPIDSASVLAEMVNFWKGMALKRFPGSYVASKV